MEADLPVPRSLALRDCDWRPVEQPHGGVPPGPVQVVQIIETVREEGAKRQGVEHVRVPEELRRHLPHVAQLAWHAQDLVVDLEERVGLLEEERVPPLQS